MDAGLAVPIPAAMSGADRAANVGVVLASVGGGAVLGLVIRRARQEKTRREVDPRAPLPSWLMLKRAGYDLARFESRLVAQALDAFAAFVFILAMHLTGAPAWARAVVDVGAMFAYYGVGNGRGGTLGARVAGIRVVLADGARPGMARGLIRHAVSYLSLIAFALGFFWSLWDEGVQTWHDKAARTYVVFARAAVPSLEPGAPPSEA